MMFLPGIIGMDGFNGGFALAFFGGFVVIVGIISVVVFARLARLSDSILKKENILAHWTYSLAEWQQYIEEEHIQDSSDKRNLFIMVAVIAVLVGLVMLVIHPDNPLLIFYIIFGLIVVIGLAAYLSSIAPYQWNKKHLGEVYIARDGTYINRKLHIWKGLGTALVSAEYEAGKYSLPRINIEYSSPNGTMRNYYTARIPVPRGQEEIAEKIVTRIQADHLGK